MPAVAPAFLSEVAVDVTATSTHLTFTLGDPIPIVGEITRFGYGVVLLGPTMASRQRFELGFSAAGEAVARTHDFGRATQTLYAADDVTVVDGTLTARFTHAPEHAPASARSAYAFSSVNSHQVQTEFSVTLRIGDVATATVS